MLATTNAIPSSIYQGGTHVELLSPISNVHSTSSTQLKAPLPPSHTGQQASCNNWWRHVVPATASKRSLAPLTRVYDKQLKGYCFHLHSAAERLHQSRLVLVDPLNLLQPCLVFQVRVPWNALLTIELTVTDTHHNRRLFLLSSVLKDIKRTPLHAALPLPDLPRETWLNLMLDLRQLVSSAFPPYAYAHLDQVTVGGPGLQVRRVFTMATCPPDEMTEQAWACIPRAMQFAVGVPYAIVRVPCAVTIEQSTVLKGKFHNLGVSSPQQLHETIKHTKVAFGTRVPLIPQVPPLKGRTFARRIKRKEKELENIEKSIEEPESIQEENESLAADVTEQKEYDPEAYNDSPIEPLHSLPEETEDLIALLNPNSSLQDHPFIEEERAPLGFTTMTNYSKSESKTPHSALSSRPHSRRTYDPQRYAILGEEGYVSRPRACSARYYEEQERNESVPLVVVDETIQVDQVVHNEESGDEPLEEIDQSNVSEFNAISEMDESKPDANIHIISSHDSYESEVDDGWPDESQDDSMEDQESDNDSAFHVDVEEPIFDEPLANKEIGKPELDMEGSPTELTVAIDVTENRQVEFNASISMKDEEKNQGEKLSFVEVAQCETLESPNSSLTVVGEANESLNLNLADVDETNKSLNLNLVVVHDISESPNLNLAVVDEEVESPNPNLANENEAIQSSNPNLATETHERTPKDEKRLKDAEPSIPHSRIPVRSSSISITSKATPTNELVEESLIPSYVVQETFVPETNDVIPDVIPSEDSDEFENDELSKSNEYKIVLDPEIESKNNDKIIDDHPQDVEQWNGEIEISNDEENASPEVENFEESEEELDHYDIAGAVNSEQEVALDTTVVQEEAEVVDKEWIDERHTMEESNVAFTDENERSHGNNNHEEIESSDEVDFTYQDEEQAATFHEDPTEMEDPNGGDVAEDESQFDEEENISSHEFVDDDVHNNILPGNENTVPSDDEVDSELLSAAEIAEIPLPETDDGIVNESEATDELPLENDNLAPVHETLSANEPRWTPHLPSDDEDQAFAEATEDRTEKQVENGSSDGWPEPAEDAVKLPLTPIGVSKDAAPEPTALLIFDKRLGCYLDPITFQRLYKRTT